LCQWVRLAGKGQGKRSLHGRPFERFPTGRFIMNRVAAIFKDRADAELAIAKLRTSGISDQRISVVEGTRETRADRADKTDVSRDPGSDLGRGAATGAAVGAGVGALFGLAAVAIPGIGPFITAGALASALGVTGGAAVAGATVGGTAGALSGALAKWGLDKADADYFSGEIERGGTFVAVDTYDGAGADAKVKEIFRECNGQLSRTRV
jgi:hypothetical protein